MSTLSDCVERKCIWPWSTGAKCAQQYTPVKMLSDRYISFKVPMMLRYVLIGWSPKGNGPDCSWKNKHTISACVAAYTIVSKALCQPPLPAAILLKQMLSFKTTQRHKIIWTLPMSYFEDTSSEWQLHLANLRKRKRYAISLIELSKNKFNPSQSINQAQWSKRFINNARLEYWRHSLSETAPTKWLLATSKTLKLVRIGDDPFHVGKPPLCTNHVGREFHWSAICVNYWNWARRNIPVKYWKLWLVCVR